MWLSDIFTGEELEEKTRILFQEYKYKGTPFEEVFENQFLVSYKLAFGDLDYEEGLLSMLEEYYPNEYYIKQSFSEKYLKNRNAIFEYPVEESRANHSR